MVYYGLGSAADKALLAEAMEKWHGDLAEQGVRVEFILASRTDDKPAVTHGGYPALATVRVVPLKDRLVKKYDAELLVASDSYAQLSNAGRLALLDHELSHLSLKRKLLKRPKNDPSPPDWVVDRDDLGRPKLRLRKGDWNAGDGFSEVVSRHGDKAIEFENLRLAYGRAREAAGSAAGA